MESISSDVVRLSNVIARFYDVSCFLSFSPAHRSPLNSAQNFWGGCGPSVPQEDGRIDGPTDGSMDIRVSFGNCCWLKYFILVHFIGMFSSDQLMSCNIYSPACKSNVCFNVSFL